MTTEEAKQKIFARLCDEHQKPGSDGWVKRENLHEELGIPEQELGETLKALRGDPPHDLNIELDRTHTSVRLGIRWRRACEQGQKP